MQLQMWKAVQNKTSNNAGALEKALANHLFREVIEDAHAEYGISDKDMESMNRKAANRAKLFVEKVMINPEMLEAFSVLAIEVLNWDKPVLTDDEESHEDLLKLLALEIKNARDKNTD